MLKHVSLFSSAYSLFLKQFFRAWKSFWLHRDKYSQKQIFFLYLTKYNYKYNKNNSNF